MARNDFLFTMRWDGLDELVQYLERMEAEMDRILIEEYSRFALLVEEGTKALAPHDRGDLTDQINAETARRTSDGIESSVGVNSVYGVRRHEEPPRPGVHPKYENGAKFPNYYKDGRGARTRSKGSWRGESPGRKYMERAVNLTQDDFDEMNQRALSRIMGDGGGS